MVLYIYSVKQTKNYGSASNFPYGRLSKLWYPKTLDFPIIQYHPIILDDFGVPKITQNPIPKHQLFVKAMALRHNDHELFKV